MSKQTASIPKSKVRASKQAVPLDDALTMPPDVKVGKDELTEQKRPHRPRSGRTFSDMAADSTLFYIGHYWPNALKLFPYDRGMNQCDKYYPQAHGGPLWIDEEGPKTMETRDFKKKAEVMKAQGLRYIVIKRDATETDILELIA